MANTDQVRGLRLVNSLSGRQPQIKRYFIPSTDSTAVFVGDLVKLAGSADSYGVATVAQCAAGNPTLGVVVGVDQVKGVTTTNLNLYRTHRPASTAMYVWVCDDPAAVYEIQCDDVGNTIAAADIGLNADVIVAAGDTTTGWSGMELDSSTAATTSTKVLRILGVSPNADNEAFVANQKVLVKINVHTLEATDISGTPTGSLGT